MKAATVIVQMLKLLPPETKGLPCLRLYLSSPSSNYYHRHTLHLLLAGQAACEDWVHISALDPPTARQGIVIKQVRKLSHELHPCFIPLSSSPLHTNPHSI